MPKLEMLIPHGLPEAEALSRIRGLLDQVKVQFAGKISDLNETWNGNIGTFSFKAMGVKVSGTLGVMSSDIKLSGNIPFVALPFKNKIESVIRERAKALLASPIPSPTPQPTSGGPGTGNPPTPPTPSDTDKKPEPQESLNILNRWKWLWVGLLVTVSAIIVTLTILVFLGKLNWITGITIPVFIILISWHGLYNVPEQHYGVLKVLQRRKEKEVFEEGWTWVVPGAMSIKSVSAKQQVTTIPQAGGEALTVNTIDNSDPNNPKRLVVMKARIVIRWRINHPWKFLNVQEQSAEQNIVERTIGYIAIKSLRQIGSEGSDLDFMEGRDTWEQRVLDEVGDDKDRDGKHSIDRMGVMIDRVIIPKIDYLDLNTVKAYEQVTRANKKREADRQEVVLIQDAITSLKTGNPDMSDDEVSRLVLTQLGKITRTETRGDLTNVAAIAAQLLEKYLSSKNKGGTP